MYEARKLIHQAQSDSILFAHRASEQLTDQATDEALRLCEEGVKRFPFYAEGHYVLARCYQELDRLDEAQAEFERTLAFNPGHLKALKALAFINYKKKMRPHGRSILETMALYDPLNAELIEFLNRPEVDTSTEKQEQAEVVEPISQSTESTAEPIIQTAVEENAFEEEAVATASIDETQFIMNEKSDEDTVISFDVEEDFEEMPVTEEDFDLNFEQEETVLSEVPSKPAEALDFEEAAILDEDKAPVSDETALHNVVDELFSEEAPAIDLDLGPDSPGLDLEDIADLTATDSFERADFERNTIDEHLDDTQSFMKPLDLDQFDNTDDDFSTLIEGYFQNSDEEVPVQEDGKTNDNADLEQPVEERSFLDTSVIFKERRSEEQETEIPSDIVEDRNKVADELDQMNTQVTLSVEQEIEEATNLPEADNQDELLKVQEPKQTIDSLGEVIERIENTQMPREKITEDFDSKDAASFDDEDVNMDDILKNPTLLTPTFGEILIAQKKFQDAREVFKALSKSDPENIRFKKKIEFLDKIVAMHK